MKGKEKCKILKELRAQIAAANDIEWTTENCTHKGECRGTCPKCEAEVVMLERAIERRKALGKTVALTGLAVGMIATSTACSAEQWQIWGGETDGVPLPDQTYTSQATSDKKTTEAVQTTTKRVEVEVDGEMVTAGDPAPICYYTDFTLFDARTFETTKEIYFEEVVDSDGNSSSFKSVPEGVRFEVVGETDYYWLVSYVGSYYCVWKDSLDESAVEVQTDEAVDESDDSAVEDDE